MILRLPPGEIKIEAVGPFYRWPYTSYSTTRELSAGETLVLRLATRNKAIESADDDVPDEEQIKSYRTVTYFSEYSPWNPYVLAELRELSVVSL
ncbi:MAG: hypothetical protein O3A51_08580 [Verrucomicrobia bacterium]|nr:hypothetical protein [Verrucomicrobiota bacterium]